MIRHKKPPYVHQYSDRHSRPRLYFRKLGRPRVALRGPLYSPDFWTDYERAKAGVLQPETGIGANRTKTGTISALIMQYYNSSMFTGLAPSTKSTYRNQLERFRTAHGDKPVAAIRTAHIDHLLGSIAAKSTAQAHKLRKRLLMILGLAVTWEYRTDNPMLVAQRVKHKEKGYRSWTNEDIAAYRIRWPMGTPQRIAFEVLLHTGLRRSDAVRLGPQHLQGNFLSINTKKSGEIVGLNIPVHPTLRRHLDTLPKGGLTFIVTEYGLGRSEKAFTNWIREAAHAAGLPNNSSPHGVRKAACRRLAEAGCSTAQIMAITGQSLSVVERYIWDFNRKRLAQSAIDAVEDDLDENEPQTHIG